MKKRILYAVATVFLLFIEVIIALYVHDDFIRPYVGDVFVVIVIYTFIRIFVPEKCRLLPLFIFIFAAGVELLQFANVAEILGVADNKFLKILIGAVFDIKDIVCYAVGCVILCIYEWIRVRRNGKTTSANASEKTSDSAAQTDDTTKEDSVEEVEEVQATDAETDENA